ncbi:hypothetical protein [Rhodoplanes sp. SY1]|uniref:hypothetical protein n=1 Tax=Rhodoplanes sp. SY1 TaxID=3166646 RepID=UPI0038B69997
MIVLRCSNGKMEHRWPMARDALPGLFLPKLGPSALPAAFLLRHSSAGTRRPALLRTQKTPPDVVIARRGMYALKCLLTPKPGHPDDLMMLPKELMAG